MDKIKFLKDIEMPLVSINGVRLSEKRLQAILELIQNSIYTVENSVFVFDENALLSDIYSLAG